MHVKAAIEWKYLSCYIICSSHCNSRVIFFAFNNFRLLLVLLQRGVEREAFNVGCKVQDCNGEGSHPMGSQPKCYPRCSRSFERYLTYFPWKPKLDGMTDHPSIINEPALWRFIDQMSHKKKWLDWFARNLGRLIWNFFLPQVIIFWGPTIDSNNAVSNLGKQKFLLSWWYKLWTFGAAPNFLSLLAFLSRFSPSRVLACILENSFGVLVV